MAWNGAAEKEELKWKEAAAALHRQQAAYLRILERSAGLEAPRTSTAMGIRSDHIVALETALMESREAHASTLRQAREREISLETHISEQALALRNQALHLEKAELRAAAERHTLALEMRGVDLEAISGRDHDAARRADIERRLLASELLKAEATTPPPPEQEVDR